MFISRLQVEEGFLDGLDLTFRPGLNVLIGGRGTGKTSVIELLRYGLGVRGYTETSDAQSKEHALSILGTGQVTITLQHGNDELVVSRSKLDAAPRSTAPFEKPIVFSQKEIESVGIDAGGRLRLVDGFSPTYKSDSGREALLISEIASQSSEIADLFNRISELDQQSSKLPAIEAELATIAKNEREILQKSNAAKESQTKLEDVRLLQSKLALKAGIFERATERIVELQHELNVVTLFPPEFESWPKEIGGPDELAAYREILATVNKSILTSSKQVAEIAAGLGGLREKLDRDRVPVEETSRRIRKEIESFQEGAGAIARTVSQLREHLAQLKGLKGSRDSVAKRLNALKGSRGTLLDELDAIREARFDSRRAVAQKLTNDLAGKIRVEIERAGQSHRYIDALTSVLRGSGLKYGELAPALAEKLSPRELVEASEVDIVDEIATLAGITRMRAARVAERIRESGGGMLLTVPVEDDVDLSLLDGTIYKDMSDLSTGQKCTVILPIVLRHTEKVLLLDQPEDHLDNAFVVSTVVEALRKRAPGGQIVISTHNANIPVLGEAEFVLHMGSDGQHGFIKHAGDLGDSRTVDAITSVMEGGREAFRRRAIFYRDHDAGGNG